MLAQMLAESPNYVYIIDSDDGSSKVGISSNPRARLASLQTGNHRRLVLTKSRDVGCRAIEIERLVHKRLAKFRVGGEWFRAPFSLISANIEMAVLETNKARQLQRWRRLYRKRSDEYPLRNIFQSLSEVKNTEKSASLRDVINVAASVRPRSYSDAKGKIGRPRLLNPTHPRAAYQREKMQQLRRDFPEKYRKKKVPE